METKQVRQEAEGCPKTSEPVTDVLRLVVPYTTPDLTRAALLYAGLCSDLDVHVSLIDAQVVPFPRPLTEPPVDKDHTETRLQDLFEQSGLSGRVEVFYTRDRMGTLLQILEPKSLVIVAAKKRLWPTREKKLARTLSKAGHQVVLLPVR